MRISWKKIFKICGIIIGLFILIIIGVYAYVSSHKKEMLARIQHEFNDSFNGTLSIDNIEPDLWKQFPNISLALRGVVIRDTLWQKHHIDFLKAKNVYIKLKFLPLLYGRVSMSKLIVSDGEMTIFDDENHMTNKGIFEKEKKESKEKSTLNINHFEIERFKFKSTNFYNKKHFEFTIPQLTGRLSSKNGINNFYTNGSVQVQKISFNTDKGSYFENKEIRLNINFSYNLHEKSLSLNKQIFSISDNKVEMSGTFFLNKATNYFNILISSPKTDYKEGLSWLPATVRQSLDSFVFERPINFSMHVEGKLKDQRIPYVRIESNFEQNKLNSKLGVFDSCSFHLAYINGNLKDHLFGDEYSYMRITQLKALYNGIPFQADTTSIFNLKHTKVSTNIKANFPVKRLNNVFGKRSFAFGEGTAEVAMHYDGGVKSSDGYPNNIEAKIEIKDAAMTYLPRQMKLQHCNVVMEVKNNDVLIQQSVLNTQRSKIFVSAYAKDFISLYRYAPEKIVIDASVKSDKIDLNEFQNFIRKRGSGKPVKIKSAVGNGSDFLDNAFDESRTNLNIAVGHLVYKRFEAKNLQAKLTLLEDGINMQNISLAHSDGTVNLKGQFTGSNTNKPSFHIDASINQAAIDKLLYSFDNFGQKTFMPGNMSGIIDLKANLSGNFDANAQLIPESLNGTTSFEIQQGQLIDFKPIQRMGRLVFKKDRLALVRFEKIKNTFTIKGNEIRIPPMWVNTDLIDMQLQGVYNLGIGTDLLIEIPLFKFTKADISSDSTLANNKGFRLYIEGKDNEVGDLKFSLKLKNSDISAARQERKRAKEKRKRLKALR